ncbi:hypothetical protein BKN38_09420 [Helicobacter sp. CLO-3]|uniref:hypothetical protein n=1 Tax=unclassified Helicobacter TaxID=2593540 RepID=UPI000805E4A5|nr:MULTISPECIES: hypothetical protein [unclassified Helicobacter]OBV28655.1 hypothetical protein BA723_08690 [Helicobacter sp. CLO-3]OHU81265.1 hypothetical protein BKN38_09420 [Helicobacter sp. CLO-3]
MKKAIIKNTIIKNAICFLALAISLLSAEPAPEAQSTQSAQATQTTPATQTAQSAQATQASQATQTPLTAQDSDILSSDELKTLSQNAQKDILDSKFFKEINKPRVIAISDFFKPHAF